MRQAQKIVLMKAASIDDLVLEIRHAISILESMTLLAGHSFTASSARIQAEQKKLREETENRIDHLLSSCAEHLNEVEDLLECQLSTELPVKYYSIREFQVAILLTLSDDQKTLSQQFGEIQIKHVKQIVSANATLSKVGALSTSNKQSLKRYDYDDDQVTDEEDNLDLDDNLRQELEVENNVLKTELDSYLSATKKAEQQLHQISELLSLFNTKIVEQREVIQQLNQDADKSNEQLEKGNEELRKTDERATNDIQVFLAYLIAAILLLIYDW